MSDILTDLYNVDIDGMMDEDECDAVCEILSRARVEIKRLRAQLAAQQGEAVAPSFPVALRKMWSGSEVQEWIDANWKPQPPAVHWQPIETAPKDDSLLLLCWFSELYVGEGKWEFQVAPSRKYRCCPPRVRIFAWWSNTLDATTRASTGHA